MWRVGLPLTLRVRMRIERGVMAEANMEARTTADARRQWREAERTVALARRARIAAETQIVVQSTRAGVADAESESAIADVQVAEAHDRYRAESDRAAEATER